MSRKIALLSLLCLSLLWSAPITSAQGGSPEDVVGSFLDAWNGQNLQAMWDLLHTESQNAYPFNIFEQRYNEVHNRIGFTGVSYTIHTWHEQGQSAAVQYDVVIASSLVGNIADTGRTMRLMRDSGDQWRIIWSRMDILNMLTDQTTLSADGAMPARATIYDRNGQPIAQPGQTTLMYASQSGMNRQACEDVLVELTRRPRIGVQNQINRYPTGTFYLGELNTEIYNANSGRLAACGIVQTNTRNPRAYYGGSAMAHVLGYMGGIPQEELDAYTQLGYPPGVLVGRFGIERQYEQLLAGAPGRVLRIADSNGEILRELGTTTGQDPVPLMLTIDRNLQVTAANALASAYDYAGNNWGRTGIAGGAAAVVLDVNTGAIRAMVSYPFFDPLLFDYITPEVAANSEFITQLQNDSRRPLRNHAVSDRYAPGSVFKIVTAAAALNEGVTQPDEIFNCEHYWIGTEQGDTIARRQDWRVVDQMPPAGSILPYQAIAASCNPFFWEMGARLAAEPGGLRKIVEYSNLMGIGTEYNIFDGAVGPEAPAQFNLEGSDNTTGFISSAVGQADIQVPPIQMAVMTAAVANGGTVLKPYIVQQIGGMDDVPVIRAENEMMGMFRQLQFEDGVLETLQKGMCNAVANTELGTAYWVFQAPDEFPPAPYTACGKTGTAEAGNAPNAWFIAYAPAENPEIAVVVTVETSREGSEVAAPIARRILDNYFNAPVKPYPEWWFNDPYNPVPRVGEGQAIGG